MHKLYYSISEISKIVDEETHILRYWEKEFGQLSPKKNRAGNRTYSQRDLLIIKMIKDLIRNEKLSLRGAKEKLNRMLSNNSMQEAEESESLFEELPDDNEDDNTVKNLNELFHHNETNLELVSLKSLLVEIRDYLRS